MSMQHLASGLSVLADRHASVRQQVAEAARGVETAHAQGDKSGFDRALAALQAQIEALHALVEASHTTATAMADRVVPAYASEVAAGSAITKGRPTRTGLPAGEA